MSPRRTMPLALISTIQWMTSALETRARTTLPFCTESNAYDSPALSPERKVGHMLCPHTGIQHSAFPSVGVSFGIPRARNRHHSIAIALRSLPNADRRATKPPEPYVQLASMGELARSRWLFRGWVRCRWAVKLCSLRFGGVAERLKAAVLKTAEGESPP